MGDMYEEFLYYGFHVFLILCVHMCVREREQEVSCVHFKQFSYLYVSNAPVYLETRYNYVFRRYHELCLSTK